MMTNIAVETLHRIDMLEGIHGDERLLDDLFEEVLGLELMLKLQAANRKFRSALSAEEEGSTAHREVLYSWIEATDEIIWESVDPWLEASTTDEQVEACFMVVESLGWHETYWAQRHP